MGHVLIDVRCRAGGAGGREGEGQEEAPTRPQRAPTVPRGTPWASQEAQAWLPQISLADCVKHVLGKKSAAPKHRADDSQTSSPNATKNKEVYPNAG